MARRDEKAEARQRLEKFYHRGGRPAVDPSRIKPSADGSGWRVETDRDRRGAPSLPDNYQRSDGYDS